MKTLTKIESALVVQMDSKTMFPCFSLKEASHLTRQFIDAMIEEGEEPGNLMGGLVYHPVKGLVAHVSFNGRVWSVTKKADIHKLGKPEFVGDSLNNHFEKVFA